MAINVLNESFMTLMHYINKFLLTKYIMNFNLIEIKRMANYWKSFHSFSCFVFFSFL